MIDLELAQLDPASVFKTPKEVLENKRLSRQQKIDILKRWAYDEREMAVAEEENMISRGPYAERDTLHEVMTALLSLGIESDQEDPPPTKQG